VVLAFLSANVSLSYLHLFLTFLRLNHPMLLSSCRTQNYQSLTFIILLHPYIVNRRVPFSKFLDEFSSFLSLAATTPHEFIITCDFNIHLDNSTDTLASQFLSMLFSFNLTQHLGFSYSRQKPYSRPGYNVLRPTDLHHLCLLPTGLLQTPFPFSPNSLSTAFHCLLQVITRSAVFIQYKTLTLFSVICNRLVS